MYERDTTCCSIVNDETHALYGGVWRQRKPFCAMQYAYVSRLCSMRLVKTKVFVKKSRGNINMMSFNLSTECSGRHTIHNPVCLMLQLTSQRVGIIAYSTVLYDIKLHVKLKKAHSAHQYLAIILKLHCQHIHFDHEKCIVRVMAGLFEILCQYMCTAQYVLIRSVGRVYGNRFGFAIAAY